MLLSEKAASFLQDWLFRPPAFVINFKNVIYRTCGPGCSKLTTLLVNKTLNFKHIIGKKAAIFCLNNVRNFCTAKVPHNLSAKNIISVELVTTERLNKSSTITLLS